MALLGPRLMRGAGVGVPVASRVRVQRSWDWRRRNGTRETDQVPAAQQDQHQPGRKLHGETESGGNHQVEQNDGAAGDEDRDGVTESPNTPDKGRAPRIALLADDRTYCDYVIRIGGVTHAEKKS